MKLRLVVSPNGNLVGEGDCGCSGLSFQASGIAVRLFRLSCTVTTHDLDACSSSISNNTLPTLSNLIGPEHRYRYVESIDNTIQSPYYVMSHEQPYGYRHLVPAFRQSVCQL